jgi:hypothetical protein
MSGTRRSLVVAGLVAAVLVGIFLHGGVRAAPEPRIDGSSASAVVDWSPAGVVPAAFRARAWGDSELVSLADLVRGRVLGLAPAGLAGLVAGALAWWRLPDADRRPGRRPPRALLPGRRAPPALAPA